MTQTPFALRDGCILGFLDAPRIDVGAHCDDGTFTAGGFAPVSPGLTTLTAALTQTTWR